MQEFRDRVAVITGAASGIGRALAQRCAQEGMKVVLADVEESALIETAAEVRASGAPALAVVTDVSNIRAVEALAQQTLDMFGAVHLLCNNAGVAAGTTIWDSTLADWEWVLAVNLWGVIYGVRVFVPIMLSQDTDCHIVNTASIAGLIAGPGLGVYKVAKHGVVTLSETLYYELARSDPNSCRRRSDPTSDAPGGSTRNVTRSGRGVCLHGDPERATLHLHPSGNEGAGAGTDGAHSRRAESALHHNLNVQFVSDL